MDTAPDRKDASLPLFSPLSGWEAATRWNAATFDWMAKGWQQWLSLLTTVPADPALAAQVTPQACASAERPQAKAEPKRSARSAGGKSRSPRSKPKVRARG